MTADTNRLHSKALPLLKQAAQLLRESVTTLDIVDTEITKVAAQPEYWLDIEELRELSNAR